LIYADLGQYAQALGYSRQALVIGREIGDRLREEANLIGIGNVYRYLGQYSQALAYSERALVIGREIGDQLREGAALANLGAVYADLGQYSQALESYEQAVAISHEIGDRRGEGMYLNDLGNVHRNLGQYPQALAYSEQALEIAREIGDRLGEGVALTNLGLMCKYLGQYQEAHTILQDSIDIHTAIGNIKFLWRAQRGLGSIEVHLNQHKSAITHYEQALNTIENLRTGLTEKEHKLSFMQRKMFVYDELIDLLQDLHQKHPNKGYDRKALEIFERKQGRVFLEEMGQSGARLFAGIPEILTQHELDLDLQLEQTLTQLGDKRAKMITKQNKELIQNLEERENTLLVEQEALQNTIKTEYPDYYALRYPKPVALADLQQHVLQPGELMLVYGVMQEKTCLWVIGPETFELHVLGVGEEVLAEKVAIFREALEVSWVLKSKSERGLYAVSSKADQPHDPVEQQRVSFAQVSHEFYNLLIPDTVRPLFTSPRSSLEESPPLLQGEGRKTLMIVPTGPLYALPFEALVPSPPTPLPKGEGSTLPLPLGEG